MSNVSLLPCPFCGGEARFVWSWSADEDCYYEAVRCTVCDAKIELKDEEKDGLTIEKWNRRSPTGEWIYKSEDTDKRLIEMGYFYKCSNCGQLTYMRTDYCPDCGAKMRDWNDD